MVDLKKLEVKFAKVFSETTQEDFEKWLEDKVAKETIWSETGTGYAMAQPDCSNHKKELFGQTDMKVVAEAIGDLHYETLSKLFWELQIKLFHDSLNDLNKKHFKLSHKLQRASMYLYEASNEIESAWQISKPHMK